MIIYLILNPKIVQFPVKKGKADKLIIFCNLMIRNKSTVVEVIRAVLVMLMVLQVLQYND